MRLWILQPIVPWEEKYDVVNCIVIRAANEVTARKLATRFGGWEVENNQRCWMDPLITSCKQLQSKGREQVVAMDMREG